MSDHCYHGLLWFIWNSVNNGSEEYLKTFIANIWLQLSPMTSQWWHMPNVNTNSQKTSDTATNSYYKHWAPKSNTLRHITGWRSGNCLDRGTKSTTNFMSDTKISRADSFLRKTWESYQMRSDRSMRGENNEFWKSTNISTISAQLVHLKQMFLFSSYF